MAEHGPLTSCDILCLAVNLSRSAYARQLAIYIVYAVIHIINIERVILQLPVHEHPGAKRSSQTLPQALFVSASVFACIVPLPEKSCLLGLFIMYYG